MRDHCKRTHLSRRHRPIALQMWIKVRLAPMCPYLGTISLAFVGPPTIKVQLNPYNTVRLMRIPVLQVRGDTTGTRGEEKKGDQQGNACFALVHTTYVTLHRCP